jgi:glucose-1-phosphate adenylyltransferase
MTVHAGLRDNEGGAGGESVSPIATFILAGGQGNRLYPLTRAQAKPAVSFGASGCLLDLTLLNCYRSGIARVTVAAQYHVATLIDRVRTGWAPVEDRGGMAIFFRLPRSAAGPFRGTADAVWRTLDAVPGGADGDVLILSGDHVYAMDYRPFLSFHRERDADLTIAASLVDARESRRFGILAADPEGRVTSFWEKPDYRVVRPLVGLRLRPAAPQAQATGALVRASMGVYVFRASVLRRVLAAWPGENRGFDFGKDIIPALVGSHRTFAYDFVDARGSPCYWRDVGTVSAYYEAQMDLVRRRPPFRMVVPDDFPGSRLTEFAWHAGARAAIAGESDVEGRVTASLVAPGALIARGAVVDRSVLLEGAVVEAGALVREAVLGPHARVKRGAVVCGGPPCSLDQFPPNVPGAGPMGRIFRTLQGIAVVPGEEIIAPEPTLCRAASVF